MSFTGLFITKPNNHCLKFSFTFSDFHFVGLAALQPVKLDFAKLIEFLVWRRQSRQLTFKTSCNTSNIFSMPGLARPASFRRIQTSPHYPDDFVWRTLNAALLVSNFSSYLKSLMSWWCVHKAAKDVFVSLSFFLWLLRGQLLLWNLRAVLDFDHNFASWILFFFFFFCLLVFALYTQLPNPENRTWFWTCGAPFSPASDFLMKKLVISFPNLILLVSFLSAEICCLLDEVQSSLAMIICQPLLPQLSPPAVWLRIL